MVWPTPPRTREDLAGFLAAIQPSAAPGRAEALRKAIDWPALLALDDGAAARSPTVFAPTDFPDGERQWESGAQRATARSYSEWAAREANLASELHRAGVEAHAIFDRLRQDRFLYQIECRGHPLAFRAVFGAWRRPRR